MKSMEYMLETFFDSTKLHFSLLDAKTDCISTQFKRFVAIIEPRIVQLSNEVTPLKQLVSDLVQEMQSLKSRQDMMYIKQDRIQSTLADNSCSGVRTFHSAYKEASVVYTPSSGFVSPPVANVVPTPSLYHPMPTFTSPTQQAAGVPFNMDSIPTGREQISQEKPYSDFIDLDAHSMISDEDIQSFLSIDWDTKTAVSTTKSDPGIYNGRSLFNSTW